MSDLATLKAEAMQNLERAYANSKMGGLYINARANCRDGRHCGPPRRLFTLVWRTRSRKEEVLVEVDAWQDLDAVALTLYGWLEQRNNRSNVFEFPAQLQESA